MLDSQKAEYARLRKEGRWPEASAYRNEERKRLRAAGRSKQESKEESWALMLKAYPADEAGHPAGERRSVEANSNDFPDVVMGVADFDEQVRWAARFLGADPHTIPKRQIPSPGHIAMLKFADRNLGRFYEWVRNLEARDSEAKKTEHQFVDDGRPLFKIFDVIIAKLERRQAREAASEATVAVL